MSASLSALRFHRVLAVLGMVACAALAGCTGFSNRMANVITPYKVEVVQGNFVSREQVAALKPGMTRNQVKDILGSPLLSDVFHDDRWDYVFTIRRQGVEAQARRMTVYFKGDVLDKFEGDEMPSEADFVASLDSHARKNVKVPPLEATEEQLKKFPVPAEPTIENPPPVPSPTSYPPLELPRR